MKLLCDVCCVSPASLMCCADEACLCAACDSRIHGANKLAGKHHRLPLLPPPSSSDHLPRCDICQDKAGYFFCLEDRSLLCRDCDFAIHSSNSLASKHNRFLVAGIRVSLQHIDASESPQTCSPPSHKGSSRPSSSPRRKSVKVASSSSNNTTMSSTPILDNLNPNPPPPVREIPRLSPTSAPNNATESVFSMPPASLQKTYTGQRNAISPNGKESYTQQVLASSRGQPQTLRSTTDSAMNSNVLGIQQSSSSPAASYVAVCDLYAQSGHTHQGGRNTAAYWTTTNRPPADDANMDGNMAPPPPVTLTFSNGYVRRGSIAEYLTETIPGWKVDEFFNLYGIETAHSFADCGSARGTATNSGDTSSPANSSHLDDSSALHRSLSAAEVPSMPSPPTLSGIPRSVMKPWNYGKPIARTDNWEHHQLDVVASDDTSVVPDIGGVSCTPEDFISVDHVQKRRRQGDYDFWWQM